MFTSSRPEFLRFILLLSLLLLNSVYQDEYKSLQLENEALSRIKDSQTPDTQRLLDLQRKIEQVEEKMEERVGVFRSVCPPFLSSSVIFTAIP